MHVVKHLYALTHGSTYCTCRILTVTLPVGVCAHVLGSYLLHGGMQEPWGVATLVCMGSATDQGLWFGGWLQNIYLLSDDIAPMHYDIGQASWKFSWFSRKKFLAL